MICVPPQFTGNSPKNVHRCLTCMCVCALCVLSEWTNSMSNQNTHGERTIQDDEAKWFIGISDVKCSFPDAKVLLPFSELDWIPRVRVISPRHQTWWGSVVGLTKYSIQTYPNAKPQDVWLDDFGCLGYDSNQRPRTNHILDSSIFLQGRQIGQFTHPTKAAFFEVTSQSKTLYRWFRAMTATIWLKVVFFL